MIVAVLVGTVLALLFGQPTVGTFVAAGASLLYIGNVAVVHGISLAPFGAYWSLAMEEQYYLLWPIVLLAGRRMGHRVALAGTLLLIGVSLWLRFRGGITTPDGYRRSYYSPETNLWSLLAGSALAMWACRRPRLNLPAGLVAAALVALLMVSSVFGMRTGLRETAEPLTLITRLMAGPLSAGPALVLVLYAAQRREQAKWLCHEGFLFFGSISYALYLWHGVIDHVLGLRFGSTGVRGLIVGLISAVIATGIAVLSARYVEKPFLRLKTRWDPAARTKPVEVTAFAS
jgi:peptidoglycan/LPS O-acetylase OafA/YrhL